MKKDRPTTDKAKPTSADWSYAAGLIHTTDLAPLFRLFDFGKATEPRKLIRDLAAALTNDEPGTVHKLLSDFFWVNIRKARFEREGQAKLKVLHARWFEDQAQAIQTKSFTASYTLFAEMRSTFFEYFPDEWEAFLNFVLSGELPR